ncbi:unnamed protein product [Rotaria socialis]
MTNSPDFSIPIDNNLKSTPISHERFHRLRRIAFWSCIISVVFDIALGLTAFVNCMRTRSFAWHLTAKSIDDVNRRDRLACCVIGALFIGSFLAIETRAIQSMMSPPTVRPDMTVVIYSLIYIIVFTILSIIKMTISKQIKSTALKFDTINSIIGIIMVLPLIVWDRVIFINKFTHIDDLVQVLMVLFLFVAGGKLIVDSITIMNADYARKLREKKLQKMLKESDDDPLERFNSGSYTVGT